MSARSAEFTGRPGEVRIFDAAPVRAVMVDGEGPVGEAAFAPRMPGLYTTAYGLRFALKKRGVDEKVSPLEGLYWMVDGTTDLDAIYAPDRAAWRWTLLIALPEAATDDEIATALAAGRAKVPPEIAPVLRVERFAEGRVAQVLHVGPYGDERPTIERMFAAIAAAGLRPRGRHHEIYLGNPQRAAPEKLRTLLRQPVE